MKIIQIFLLILFTSYGSFSQKDTIWKQKPVIKYTGFLDVFYTYDFNKPKTNRRLPFLYNHNRHNEFNLNLGYLKFSVEHAKYRANIAFHAGTYVQDNYSAEPAMLKYINEANAGIAMNRKNSLWIDAGIFNSHIGFESAISIDNWTLTRSLLAEQSPYFLTGLKLSYYHSKKLEMNVSVLNGWQRIQRLSGNSMLSVGSQLKFIPNDKLTFNWSTFVGTDDPDSTRKMRYFNNLYAQFQFTKKWGMVAGIDAGIQQTAKKSSSYDYWFTPVVIVKYHLSDKWSSALRFEYFQDQTGILIPTGTANGFRTTGLSFNVDYTPVEFIACRLEGKWLNSRDEIFKNGNKLTYNNYSVTASIAIKFDSFLFKTNK